jgi:predicted signal transduction protein with EAL and GGDEF domain
VRISLDDFGTGYSSLLYLRELPIHEIKIDRRFISGLGRDRDDDAIVAGLVKLGHSVGVQIVAEGVETPTQARRLTQLGCDRAQGYLFGRPAKTFSRQDVVIPTTRPPEGRRRRTRPVQRIAPPEAEVLIADLVAEGASLHTIAAALNRRGIRTTQGNRWVGASVGRAVAEM